MSSVQQRKAASQAPMARTALEKASTEVRADLEREARVLLAKGRGLQQDALAESKPSADAGGNRQAMLVRDSMSVLSQKIARVKIMLTMLTDGRARDSLSESDADELDWMLLNGLESIEEAVGGVQSAVSSSEVAA